MITDISECASKSLRRRRSSVMNLQRSIAVLTSTLAASVCLAQSAIVSGGQVKLDQSTATTRIELTDTAGREKKRVFDKEKKSALRVTGDEPIEVVVDKNPVLFTYVAKDIVKTPTANKQAADKLAEALGGFAEQLAGAVKQAGGVAPGAAAISITSVQLDGVDLHDLSRRIMWVKNTWDELSPTIDQTLDPGTLGTARSAASRWKAGLRTNDPTAALKGIPALWRKMISPDAKFDWRVVYSDGTVKVNPPGQSTRANLTGDLRSQGRVADGDLYVQMILAIQPELENIEAQVDDISDLADAIQAIQSETLATVSPDVENDQALPIEITANTRFLPLLSAQAREHQAKRLGTYTIVFSPYDWVHMRPSLGVIYSFVKAPKFSAARDATGQLSIAATSDDYAEYSGLVSMDFTLDKYFYSGLQPFVQFGVSPSSDNLGLVLGAGIRAYKSFTFSLGVAYQRVERLSGTLATGDVIAQESDLKTSKEFSTGLYLGIAVALE